MQTGKLLELTKMKKLLIIGLLLFSITAFSQASTVKVLSTATSGTINLPNTQQDVIFLHDAGVTAGLTVNFPSTPVDGQMVIIASAGGIVSLNIGAVVGTVLNTMTGVTTGGNATWIYNLERNKWFRIR